MDQEYDRLVHLERQIGAMQRRLAILEAGATEPNLSGPPAQPLAEEQAVQGTLTYSGSLRLGDRRIKIQQREHLGVALESHPQPVSQVFAALGSPFRILILRALLEGPRTSQELQEVLAIGPVGQLYHHLKELLAAGLIVQRRRSVYAIRQEKLLPLCLVFIAAPHLVSDQGEQAETVESEQREHR